MNKVLKCSCCDMMLTGIVASLHRHIPFVRDYDLGHSVVSGSLTTAFVCDCSCRMLSVGTVKVQVSVQGQNRNVTWTPWTGLRTQGFGSFLSPWRLFILMIDDISWALLLIGQAGFFRVQIWRTADWPLPVCSRLLWRKQKSWTRRWCCWTVEVLDQVAEEPWLGPEVLSGEQV